MAINNPPLLIDDAQPTLGMNAKKFALWLFIISIVMIFAAFTSAYIVRRAEGNWLQFQLPPIFFTSSAVLVLSSATMHWAWLSAKKDNLLNMKIGLGLTLFLGLVFCYQQLYVAWPWLVENNVYFGGRTANPSGSFIYVISGVHVAHLVTGLVFLAITLIQAFRYKIHSREMLTIDMCATFWHFLDVLWIYLFIFLLTNR